MLVGAGLADARVRDLPELLRPGDLLVANDAKVLPALLFGRRGDVAVEATLLTALAPGRWRALAKPMRRLRPGDRIDFADDFTATVTARDERSVVLDFSLDEPALRSLLQRYGRMPLPPYIRCQRVSDTADQADYQTVFALREGAVAAPTAGLHFTQELIGRLQQRRIDLAFVTLFVGAGTFLPLTEAQLDSGRLWPEIGLVTQAAAQRIQRAREAGGRIVAVGTTALRLLESARDEAGRVGPFQGATELFIRPGYRCRAVDLVLTNFHLPRSSLFMLVAAFAGLARMQAAYAHAIASGYRFYSYGDASLLSPEAALR